MQTMHEVSVPVAYLIISVLFNTLLSIDNYRSMLGRHAACNM